MKRVVALVFCVALILGCTPAFSVAANNNESDGYSANIGALTGTASAYKEIIEKYAELIRSIDVDEDSTSEEIILRYVYNFATNEKRKTMDFSIHDYGFALEDINGNGSPELLIIRTGHGYYDDTILGMYSLVNNKPTALFEVLGRKNSHVVIYDNGTLQFQFASSNHTITGENDYTNGMLTDAYYKLKPDDSSLSLMEACSYYFLKDSIEYYHKVGNATPIIITEQERNIMYERCLTNVSQGFPLSFIPLFAKT